MSREEALERYVRHAEKYGTNLIIETAAEELPWSALGELSLRLQAVDPKFKLSRDMAQSMVTALFGVVDDDRLRRMTGLGLKAYNNAASAIEWKPA